MASSQLVICLVLAALVGCAVAQLVPIAGSRDLTGGYYDHYTGQYSSALTGRVYNTAPAVVAAAPVAAAPLWAPHVGIAAPIAAHHLAAPVAWVRR